MENIIAMAKDLGREIQKDPRFVRAQLAQQKADEDKALQDLIGEFNLKRMAINSESAKAEGEQDNEKMMQLNAEIREVYAKVMANESMAEYQAAKGELDEIMNAVGAILNMAAQGMDPDAYEQHNCDGHCGSCGGCH